MSPAGRWTGEADLRARLQRQWDRGNLLTEVLTGGSSFPKRFSLKGPSSGELSEQFDAVRKWIAALAAMPHFRLEMREIRHRVLGANEVPAAAWVNNLDDALAVIGQRRAARRFALLAEAIQSRRPQLLDWLATHPHKALALADIWERLLNVVDWVEAHPQPGVYLRQVDVPGVDSKFIEANRGVLSDWLDRVLPGTAIDASATGARGFARRYGFRDKPLRIRLRTLDRALAVLPGNPDADLMLDAASFVALAPPITQVFITENETNFLAFPKVKDSLLIFGSGYGFEVLADSDWLRHCRIHYWGDIDTHGFAILDQLRAALPQSQSVLMDRATLMAFEAHWGTEGKPVRRDLDRLNVDERALYDDLRYDRIRPGLRLEQERIGFGWVERALAELTSE